MINSRLVARTHYQVEEPTIVATIIRSCTSPVQSDFPDNVSRKLSSSGVRINPAAARYAVDLTKSLGLLSDNLVWTKLGHLLNVVYKYDKLPVHPLLTDVQKYFFLRVFLEFDGAAIIFFARRIEQDGRVPRIGERWTDVAQALFTETYQEYLHLATDPQDRVSLRQRLERRKARPFTGNSGRHQCYLHLQTLHRIGLVARKSDKDRIYTYNSPSNSNSTLTSKLLTLIPSVADLERTLSAGRLYQIVSELFSCSRQRNELPSRQFTAIVRQIYEQVMSTGVSLCSLQTLTEAIQIDSLICGYQPFTDRQILNRLRSMQRDAPRSIRFHVDVFGRPAFIKIS